MPLIQINSRLWINTDHVQAIVVREDEEDGDLEKAWIYFHGEDAFEQEAAAIQLCNGDTMSLMEMLSQPCKSR